jgi:hypothetical protein
MVMATFTAPTLDLPKATLRRRISLERAAAAAPRAEYFPPSAKLEPPRIVPRKAPVLSPAAAGVPADVNPTSPNVSSYTDARGGGPEVRPDPYVDYDRRFTAEGGIEITYKDLDENIARTVLRIFLWVLATAATALFILKASPLDSTFLNVVGVVLMAIIYGAILWTDDQVYRRVEIRPDCMIIEGENIFWLEQMELGWPEFIDDEKDNKVLCGIYGSRWVEYLKVHRFDDNDGAPEVFEAHLTAAMEQQWAYPSQEIR